MDRLAALRDFVARTPDDPFPRYGLAMELCARGALDEACDVFEQLVVSKPDYVAAYLMYGNALSKVGRKERAAEIYQAGVTAAQAAGDSKAQSELQAALADLGGPE